MASDERLASERFPRSSAYHPEWVLAAVGGGANSLWLTEWLAEAMSLRSGMRVLDLGCGRGASSIFLHREYGVQVWATDLWFSATERLERVRDAGAEDGVFPISADARALPFATEFFDAIVSIDAFPYWGTDDLYANYLVRFLKRDGPIGIAGAGLAREIDQQVPPPSLRRWWEPAMWCLHSPEWWSQHWDRSAVLDVHVADTMPHGWRFWLDWQRAASPRNHVEIEALEADRGRHLAYVRVVATRRAEATLEEPIASIPVEYTRTPLLRRSDPDQSTSHPMSEGAE